MFDLLAQQAPNQGTWAFIDKLARTPLSQVLIFVAVCTVIRVIIHPYLLKVPPHRRSGGYAFARFMNEVLDALVYAGVFVFMIIRPFGIQAFQIPTRSMVPTLLEGDFIVANKAIFRYSDPKHGDIVVFRPPDRAKNDDQGEVDFIKRLIGVPGDLIEVKDGILFRNGQQIEEPYKAVPRPEHTTEADYDWKLVHYDGPHEPWKDKYIPVMVKGGDGEELVANYYTGTALEYAIGGVKNMAGHSNADFKPYGELSTEELDRMKYLIDAPAAKVPADHFIMMGDNRTESYDSRGWGLVRREDIVGRSEAIWMPLSRIRRTR